MSNFYISDGATIGEKYNPAMKITDPQEAREYFEACVAQLMRKYPDMPRQEAETIERENLGYYARYFEDETYHRVLRLFEASHPIFGQSDGRG